MNLLQLFILLINYRILINILLHNINTLKNKFNLKLIVFLLSFELF